MKPKVGKFYSFLPKPIWGYRLRWRDTAGTLMKSSELRGKVLMLVAVERKGRHVPKVTKKDRCEDLEFEGEMHYTFLMPSRIFSAIIRDKENFDDFFQEYTP